MIALVKLIGILIACAGLAIIFNTNSMRKMASFWRQGKRLYAGGLLRLLLGIIFLLSAPQARLKPVMSALGILTILGGLIVFVIGIEKIKAMLDWLDKKPNSVLRLMALLVLAFGALLIYSA